MGNRVVAHSLDGRVIKGLNLDVNLAKPTCQVRSLAGAVTEVGLAELKALYFVRTFEGDPGRHDSTTLPPNDPRLHASTLVTLNFGDGEELVGLVHLDSAKEPFFFLFPVDSKSNNIRILVNRAALASVEP